MVKKRKLFNNRDLQLHVHGKRLTANGKTLGKRSYSAVVYSVIDHVSRKKKQKKTKENNMATAENSRFAEGSEEFS
jgi:hypothetical protein